MRAKSELDGKKLPVNKHNNRERKDLGKTSSKCDLKQLFCFIGYLILIFLDLWIFQIYFSIQTIIVWYFRLIIAVPIILVALRIACNSIRILYQDVRIPPYLIRKGPYRYSRHPMYFSAILIYLALDIATFSIFGFIYSILVISMYSYFAHFEEKFLILDYKKEYIDYMKNVPRWIGFSKSKSD